MNASIQLNLMDMIETLTGPRTDAFVSSMGCVRGPNLKLKFSGAEMPPFNIRP